MSWRTSACGSRNFEGGRHDGTQDNKERWAEAGPFAAGTRSDLEHNAPAVTQAGRLGRQERQIIIIIVRSTVYVDGRAGRHSVIRQGSRGCFTPTSASLLTKHSRVVAADPAKGADGRHHARRYGCHYRLSIRARARSENNGKSPANHGPVANAQSAPPSTSLPSPHWKVPLSDGARCHRYNHGTAAYLVF